MPWLIVIGEIQALDWVLEHEKMAFRDNARVASVQPGDLFAIYRTRGAHHNPSRDEGQIVALGEFRSVIAHDEVEIAGERYSRSCLLRIQESTEPRSGIPFQPLVEKLEFILSKKGWATYLRRTLVAVPEADYQLIQKAFRAHVRQIGKSTPSRS